MTSSKLLRAHAALLASLDLEIEQARDPSVYEASAPAVSNRVAPAAGQPRCAKPDSMPDPTPLRPLDTKKPKGRVVSGLSAMPRQGLEPRTY